MTSLGELWARVQRHLVRRGMPPFEADDVVQEAFLRLEQYERRCRVRSREAFLIRAATNLTIDRARRLSRAPVDERSSVDITQIAALQIAPDARVEGRQRLAHLAQGIDSLPERTRRLLLLRRVEGLAFREIAALEGMAVSAVEKQVARATLALVRWMDGW